ncbi:Lp6.6 family lipoprotein [Borreliella lusitaniae]|uniref:Lp6.6 family lipoprotein n=1 Tax=Borreliella lusitaniae TaxID=100177 RepID=A0ABZ0CJ25_9SPIR|nr:Lp6.6 family lipoprotein [Borreliella lusitaniae]WKC84944.1 Lp6.6 family lipoprotein [Borreliella lusitaniae]WNY69169.1 Lp6.6 family lipoprotein [Borreliella lusitaniae]
MTKLMYSVFLGLILFVACETTNLSDEMKNSHDSDLKVTTPMPDKSMRSMKKPMKSMKKSMNSNKKSMNSMNKSMNSMDK